MRTRILALAALLLSGAVPAAPPAEARAAGPLCNAYCETIYVGCLLTIARVDRTACTEWRKGCRDGCDA